MRNRRVEGLFRCGKLKILFRPGCFDDFRGFPEFFDGVGVDVVIVLVAGVASANSCAASGLVGGRATIGKLRGV